MPQCHLKTLAFTVAGCCRANDIFFSQCSHKRNSEDNGKTSSLFLFHNVSALLMRSTPAYHIKASRGCQRLSLSRRSRAAWREGSDSAIDAHFSNSSSAEHGAFVGLLRLTYRLSRCLPLSWRLPLPLYPAASLEAKSIPFRSWIPRLQPHVRPLLLPRLQPPRHRGPSCRHHKSHFEQTTRFGLWSIPSLPTFEQERSGEMARI